MGLTFNPQVGATTQSKIGYGGQAEGVQAAATSGTALKMAKYRESKSQYDKQLATQKEQFDTRLGIEQRRYDEQKGLQKKASRLQEKKEGKAAATARIGTSIEVGKLGLELANEYDIDIAGNLGFGDDETSIDGPGGGKGGGGTSTDTRSPGAMQQEAGGFDAVGAQTGAEGDISPRGTTTGSSGGEGSWWSQNSGKVMGTALGGVSGGMMGSSISMALFGEGKTQSTAGGAVGGAAGGYAGSGSVYGAIGGAVIGGVMGYLMG